MIRALADFEPSNFGRRHHHDRRQHYTSVSLLHVVSPALPRLLLIMLVDGSSGLPVYAERKPPSAPEPAHTSAHINVTVHDCEKQAKNLKVGPDGPPEANLTFREKEERCGCIVALVCLGCLIWMIYFLQSGELQVKGTVGTPLVVTVTEYVPSPTGGFR